jgi:type IV secretory pathway VirB4 component
MPGQPANSTQEHLPIAGIQDGVIIMTDGSVRAVLKVEPINFELKSQREQDGIIYSYQAFLNSLEFPIQIVIQSKKLDLERYLIKVESTIKDMTNDLLRIQTEDYVGFVRRLISVANIMSKRFYVIVKYAALEKQSGLSSFTTFMHRKPSGPLMDQDQFERYRTEVNNRASSIGNGLSRIGVRVSFLDTQQLIELFYGTYNPDIATEERLVEAQDMTAGLITSQDVRPDSNPQFQTQSTPEQLVDNPPTQAIQPPVQTDQTNPPTQ